MKIAESAILLVPGFGNAAEDHWLSGWEKKFPNAHRIKVPDFNHADRASWVNAVVEGAKAQTKPVMIVAHSLGVAAVAHAAPLLPQSVRAAWLVALSDWNRADLLPGVAHDFAPLPREPLPFPSQLVASRNDPYCDFETAADYANAWGAHLIDAGDVGHLNVESGHGPWPEGMMRFATFLSRTPAA